MRERESEEGKERGLLERTTSYLGLLLHNDDIVAGLLLSRWRVVTSRLGGVALLGGGITLLRGVGWLGGIFRWLLVVRRWAGLIPRLLVGHHERVYGSLKT